MNGPMNSARSQVEKSMAILSILFVSILFIPALLPAAGPIPIGQVLRGSSSPTGVETTLFSGDLVETRTGDYAAVTLRNSSLLNFIPGSMARIQRSSGTYRVDLKKGGLLFASTPSTREALGIRASAIEVKIPTSTAVSGRVVATDRYVVVSSTKGTLQVASLGKTFHLKEGETTAFPLSAQSNCSYSISPANVMAGPSGGSAEVHVTAGEGCPWTIQSNAAWITLDGASGTGNAVIHYTVLPMTGTLHRTGTILLTGQGLTATFTVTQNNNKRLKGIAVVGPGKGAAAAGAGTDAGTGAGTGVGTGAIMGLSWPAVIGIGAGVAAGLSVGIIEATKSS